MNERLNTAAMPLDPPADAWTSSDIRAIASSRRDRIRLTTFLSNFAIGGTERQVVNLIKGIDRSEFEPSFFCFGRFGEFLPEVEKDTPVTEFPIHALYDPRTMLQQLNLARRLA